MTSHAPPGPHGVRHMMNQDCLRDVVVRQRQTSKCLGLNRNEPVERKGERYSVRRFLPDRYPLGCGFCSHYIGAETGLQGKLPTRLPVPLFNLQAFTFRPWDLCGSHYRPQIRSNPIPLRPPRPAKTRFSFLNLYQLNRARFAIFPGQISNPIRRIPPVFVPSGPFFVKEPAKPVK
jgi:hypothetical protein